MTRARRVVIPMAAAAAALASAGCGTGVKTLMPTPVIFTEYQLDPVGHVPQSERFPPRAVFYATTRSRTDEPRLIEYGNTPNDKISVGLSLIGFGEPALSWDELGDVSAREERETEVILETKGVVEIGSFGPLMTTDEAAGEAGAGLWLKDLDEKVRNARDKDVLIYVHGAKVDFYNGCAFAAQLDHFMGRDMTSVAFCWPTRQDIFAYAFGTDKDRAYDAAVSLASLIELIATETDTRRIHVLAWSAGARVLTGALLDLHDRYPDDSDAEMRERFRLRTAYFAAGDIPVDEYIDALPKISRVSERLIVSSSSNDIALVNAKFFMGGDTRIGQYGPDLTDEQMETVRAADGLEVLDVSAGFEARGFDITGHDYWFTNPWASTDIVLAIRTDLDPQDRGLEPSEEPFVWSIPADYPARLAPVLELTDLRARE